MAIKKIKAQSPDPYLGKIKGDTEFARLAHLNNLVDQINANDPRPYKVYTALLTQSGGSNEQTISSGPVTQGVTYFIDGADGTDDFSNVGGPAAGTGNGKYFVAINSNVPNSYGDADLIYNTGAPVATVLENTIGNIYWTREGNNQAVGFYSANLISAFTENKTLLLIGTPNDNYGPGTGIFEIYNDWNLPNGEDKVFINTGLGAGYSYNYLDGMLYNTSIEIRVYN